MKKTQWLVLFRDIRSSIVSFISIVLFVALGAGLFMGLRWGGLSMRTTANEYLEENNFHDYIVVMPYGMTDDDVNALEALDEVSLAEGSYNLTGTVPTDDKPLLITVLSMTQKLDTTIILEGTAPVNANEIGIEQQFAKNEGLNIGDSITIEATVNDTQALNSTVFTICAIVENPLYTCSSRNLSRGRTNLGKGTIDYYTVVAPCAINRDAYIQSYSQVYVRSSLLHNDTGIINNYTDESKVILSKLEDLGKTRAPLRSQQIFDMLDSAIAQGQETIDQAQVQYEQAEVEYAQGESKLYQGLDYLRSTLSSLGYSEQFDDATQQLIASRNQLDEIGTIALNASAKLDELMVRYNQATTPEQREQIRQEFLNIFEKVKALLLPYNDILKEYGIDLNSITTIPPAQELMAKLLSKIDWAKTSLNQLIDGIDQYYNARNTLQEARVTLDDANVQISQGNEQLDELKLKRSQLTFYDSWTITTRDQNLSFVFVNAATDSTINLCYTLAILFVFIGAMICYTAIARLIRESQVLIGVQKALGFDKKEVTLRYMTYALSVVVLGLLFGFLMAYFAIEPMLHSVYKQIFIFTEYKTYFSLTDFLLIGLLELAILCFATWIACRKLLAKHAVDLLRGEDPSSGKTHFYEKTKWWKKASLYTQTTVNNLTNDVPRVIATLIGVVGCTSLIVASVTVLVSLIDTPKVHYSKVATYDDCLSYDDTVPSAKDNIISMLDSYENINYYDAFQMYYAAQTDSDGLQPIKVIVPGNTDELSEYFSLDSSIDNKPLTLTDDGVILSYTYSKYYGVKEGDTISIMDSGGNSFEVTVAGLSQHYLNIYQMILSPTYYEKLTGKAPQNNTFFIKLNGTNEQELFNSFNDVKGVNSLTNDLETMQKMFKVMTNSVQMVTYICLVISFIMAMLVLLNLNVMFINEKTRELIIMRVNGYSLKEAKKYVYRDNIVLTTLGIIIGIFVGTAMGMLVLTNISIKGSNYYITPSALACLFGVISSTLFSVITNLIALKRVGQLKLSDLNRM